MDLLAAEIARKRKAKAELAAVGGVRKYAKKGQKEEAARRALLAEKDADRGPGPGAVAGGEVEHLGEDALVVDPSALEEHVAARLKIEDEDFAAGRTKLYREEDMPMPAEALRYEVATGLFWMPWACCA